MVPPMVYLPCQAPETTAPDVIAEYYLLEDGRVALLAYTALDRLVSCCGSNQPWVLTPTAKLDELDRIRPYDVILLDTEIPAAHRRRPNGGQS